MAEQANVRTLRIVTTTARSLSGAEGVVRRGSVRREEIAAVALRLFAEKGYAATSMREISEHLNITKAALYYHYTGKEDIVRGLVDGMLDQVDELVSWAREQQISESVRREIVTRWGNIMLAHGL